MSVPSSPRSQLVLADSLNSIRWARRHAVDVLNSWHVPTPVIETVQLVVSELTTNAVRHPRRGEVPSPHSEPEAVQLFGLSLEHVGAVVRVSVWDRDPSLPLRQQVQTDATSGRGIFLVATLSHRWGYYLPRSKRGKVVWAEIPVADQDARSPASDPGPTWGRPWATGRGEPSDDEAPTRIPRCAVLGWVGTGLLEETGCQGLAIGKQSIPALAVANAMSST